MTTSIIVKTKAAAAAIILMITISCNINNSYALLQRRPQKTEKHKPGSLHRIRYTLIFLEIQFPVPRASLGISVIDVDLLWE